MSTLASAHQNARKSTSNHHHQVYRFAPHPPRNSTRCVANILTFFGWRYQKQACQIGILKIYGENRKNILTFFGQRYQKRGFLPPKSLISPLSPTPSFILFRHTKKSTYVHHPLTAQGAGCHASDHNLGGQKHASGARIPKLHPFPSSSSSSMRPLCLCDSVVQTRLQQEAAPAIQKERAQ